MRRFLLIVYVCVMSLTCFGGESVRYFKEIGVTISHPYHFEGLYPSLKPQSEDHYEFILSERGHPIRITYYNKRGQVINNKDGWAIFYLTYDDKGRLIESAFYKADGKPALGKSLGFAREFVTYDEQGLPQQLFYNPKGKVLKSPQKDWRSGWFEPSK